MYLRARKGSPEFWWWNRFRAKAFKALKRELIEAELDLQIREVE